MGDSLKNEKPAGCTLPLQRFEQFALHCFAFAIDKDAATNAVKCWRGRFASSALVFGPDYAELM
jgi:hypothetical protein